MARVVERLHLDSIRGEGDKLDVFIVPIGGGPVEVERFRRATGLRHRRAAGSSAFPWDPK
jgi:hypothetical protein